MKKMCGCGKSHMKVSPSSSLSSGLSMHCVTSTVPVPWLTWQKIGAAGSAASVVCTIISPFLLSPCQRFSPQPLQKHSLLTCLSQYPCAHTSAAPLPVLRIHLCLCPPRECPFFCWQPLRRCGVLCSLSSLSHSIHFPADETHVALAEKLKYSSSSIQNPLWCTCLTVGVWLKVILTMSLTLLFKVEKSCKTLCLIQILRRIFKRSVSLLVGSIEKLHDFRRFGEENWWWCQCMFSDWKWWALYVSFSGDTGIPSQKKNDCCNWCHQGWFPSAYPNWREGWLQEKCLSLLQFFRWLWRISCDIIRAKNSPITAMVTKHIRLGLWVVWEGIYSLSSYNPLFK